MARLPRTKTTLNRARGKMEAQLRRRAPRRTGRLQNSIEQYSFLQKTQDLESQIKMIYYGVFVNEGTKFQKPQRFVEKAIDDVVNDYIDQIGDALESDIYNTIIKPNSDS